MVWVSGGRWCVMSSQTPGGLNAYLEIIVFRALLGQLPEQSLVAEAAPVALRQVEDLEPFPVLTDGARREGRLHVDEDTRSPHTSARNFSSLAFSSPASYLMMEKTTVG